MLNASTFRDLGIECLVVDCRMCGTSERYAIYEDGVGKAFFIGCTKCGVYDSIDKENFDALYELSHSYDELMAGDISVDQFEKSMPDSIRVLYTELNDSGDVWKCVGCENTNPTANLECWNCGKPSGREPDPEWIVTGFRNPEEENAAQTSAEIEKASGSVSASPERNYKSVRLSNTVTSSWILAPVFTIPLAVAIVAIEATGMFEIPFIHFLSDRSEMDYAMLQPFQYWSNFLWPMVLLQFLLFPVFVGYLHFKLPKAVLFSLKGIEVRYRSGSKRIYNLTDVLKSEYNQEKNFLKLKMNDGKNVRVEVDIGQAASLRDYLPL